MYHIQFLVLFAHVPSYPIDVVGFVDLLILTVSPVITSPNGQQHDILPRGLLEGQGHWDAAPFSCHVWLRPVHCNH